MRLDEAMATDLDVSEADVRRAEREAAEAEELAGELERQAIEDGTATPGQVLEQRELGRFARMRIEHTRKRADKARAARRLIALGEVADDIDQLAAEAVKPNAAIGQAARKLAQAATVLRELAAQHDVKVADLVKRAKELRVEEPAPGGPRASSAHVALVQGMYGRAAGVAHGRREVRAIGGAVDDAIAAAVSGDVDAAVARIAAVHEQPEFARPDHLFIRGDGMLFGGTPEQHQQALAEEFLRELTPAEVDLYVEGKFPA